MILKVLSKKGDMTDLNNFQGIDFIDIASKIYSSIIIEILSSYLENNIRTLNYIYNKNIKFEFNESI